MKQDKLLREVSVLGRPIMLQKRNKVQLRGITIGDKLSYRFYDGQYHGVPLLFAEPKGDAASPRLLAATAENLYNQFQLPVVYILPSCPAYERQRLIDKNVYFVVSDRFAYLPMLVANERIRRAKPAKHLSPVAQYLLLYHLQVESLEGRAARDIEGIIPYSYASIALGITCLVDLHLCVKDANNGKSKAMRFPLSGAALWKEAQPYLINPVAERLYCDAFLSEEHFPVCGINALAAYTMLNTDPERMIAMSTKQLRAFKKAGALVRPNEFDGDVVIEAWKYPPVVAGGFGAACVDKLSLALSLRDDTDARVEGEVERLIEGVEWKD